MTERYVLLKNLPIEKAGTVIVSNGEDWVVEGTGVSFPYSPASNTEWFKKEINWEQEHKDLQSDIMRFLSFLYGYNGEKKEDIIRRYREFFRINDIRHESEKG